MGKYIALNAWFIILIILAVSVIFLLGMVALSVIKDKDMKWFKRLKWHLKELDKTLSNQPSHYSSKRIERFLLFLNANIMLDLIVHYLLVRDKIDWAAAVAIYTAQMIYAGFQTKQISKDVKAPTE